MIDVYFAIQAFMDAQGGPDRICQYCYAKRSECNGEHGYREFFGAVD